MRKSKPKKRIILPDPRFNDVLVSKFVNNLMYAGKKNLAFKVFYEAMDVVSEKIEDENSLDVWKKALANVTLQLRLEVEESVVQHSKFLQKLEAGRKVSIGMKNLIGFARKRHEKSMGQKLAGEIMAAYKEEGSAFKKKEDTHRMAEANKAFSHFRF